MAIIEGHSELWPWAAEAIGVAQMSFFEDMPSECDSAIGCYSHTTGEIWLTLDALRFDRYNPADIVLHELAHAYTRSFPQGAELLDRFGRHYAGCRGNGLDADHFAAELLADTMAMTATAAGASLPEGYGYFRSGGFDGCLTESDAPDETLVLEVYSTLFNCESEHALDLLARHNEPGERSRGIVSQPTVPRWDFGWDFDTDSVLLVCYGIDCITPSQGCETLTDTDGRRAAAERRIHERRCADGVVTDWMGDVGPGWEAGCEDFIPADVECLIVDAGGVTATGASIPGLLLDPSKTIPELFQASGGCVVPDCTIEDAQGEPQPGYSVSRYGAARDCIAIVGPHSAARPKQRLAEAEAEAEAERQAAEAEVEAERLAAEAAAAAERALAVVCSDDLNDDGPGWEQGCNDAGHIPDEVPCVLSGSGGWLPGYIDDRNDRLPGYFNGDGECRVNVALTSRPRAWRDCLPADGGRWTGDWTADPYNGNYPCRQTLATECANDVNRSPRLPQMHWRDTDGNRWPPGWEEGCKQAGLIPDGVPCVVSAAAALDVVARHGWRGLSGWLPGQPDSSGGCIANTALFRAVHPEIGLREWLACLPGDGGRWTGDWTANPDNGRDTCPAG